MTLNTVAIVMGLLLMAGCAGVGGTSSTVQGRFVRTIWGPIKGSNFRVNSPDTYSGRYKDRWEAKQDGILKMKLNEDPADIAGASLYMELWGGHPGVAAKRFTLNGASEYALPEVGAAKKNCTYSYPNIPLKLSELVKGENQFAFTCRKGGTFWGHPQDSPKREHGV